jgi:uncharacterized protein YaaQ
MTYLFTSPTTLALVQSVGWVQTGAFLLAVNTTFMTGFDFTDIEELDNIRIFIDAILM